MIEVAIYNTEGKQVDTVSVDEQLLGGKVRHALLKQAIVMYHANKRVGTAANKSRGLVEGSTRKLYRQKGTGNARAGMIRTPVRRGGGVAFAKYARDFSKDMPKKQKKLARNSAILAKILGEKLIVVDSVSFERPQTKAFAALLGNLNINRSCLVTIPQVDNNLYLSARNIKKVDVSVVNDLNAGEICNKQFMLFTREAFDNFIASVAN